jgi:hypothetical protein
MRKVEIPQYKMRLLAMATLEAMKAHEDKKEKPLQKGANNEKVS